MILKTEEGDSVIIYMLLGYPLFLMMSIAPALR